MKSTYLRKILIIALITGISGCHSLGIGLSLDERYQQAYQKVLTDPNDDNIKTFMKLSQEKGERDMQEANSKATADTRESDKGFTEYFKSYGNDGFKRARQ